MFVNERAELANVIQQWEPATPEQRIEKTFLLKELYVGRRELQMPAWDGQVLPTKQWVGRSKREDSSTQHDVVESLSSGLNRQRLLVASGSSSSYGCHSGDGGSAKTSHDEDRLLRNGGGATAADRRERGLRRVFLGYRVDTGVIFLFSLNSIEK